MKILDKEKFSATVAKMKKLTSDFIFVDTPEIKEILAKMIVEMAKDLVKLANAKKVKE